MTIIRDYVTSNTVFTTKIKKIIDTLFDDKNLRDVILNSSVVGRYDFTVHGFREAPDVNLWHIWMIPWETYAGLVLFGRGLDLSICTDIARDYVNNRLISAEDGYPLLDTSDKLFHAEVGFRDPYTPCGYDKWPDCNSTWADAYGNTYPYYGRFQGNGIITLLLTYKAFNDSKYLDIAKEVAYNFNIQNSNNRISDFQQNVKGPENAWISEALLVVNFYSPDWWWMDGAFRMGLAGCLYRSDWTFGGVPRDWYPWAKTVALSTALETIYWLGLASSQACKSNNPTDWTVSDYSKCLFILENIVLYGILQEISASPYSYSIAGNASLFTVHSLIRLVWVLQYTHLTKLSLILLERALEILYQVYKSKYKPRAPTDPILHKVWKIAFDYPETDDLYIGALALIACLASKFLHDTDLSNASLFMKLPYIDKIPIIEIEQSPLDYFNREYSGTVNASSTQSLGLAYVPNRVKIELEASETVDIKIRTYFRDFTTYVEQTIATGVTTYSNTIQIPKRVIEPIIVNNNTSTVNIKTILTIE